ncbi:MAG: hypothetical protein QNK23_14280 [Crocinitomicaceae bacterium]|nr:hypothetical protein [Crocinitomicaceae bacterium]
MITKRVLYIFEKYVGDGDLFIRSANDEEKEMLKNEVWMKIDSLVQNILIIHNCSASDEFIKRTNSEILELADNSTTIELLNHIAIESENW